MISWFLTKMLTRLLLFIGIKSNIATALTPIILRTLGEAKNAIDRAKAEGATDDEATADAANVILPPDHPDREVTLEDIARGNPA